MPDTKMITFKDFSGGDWGEIGEFRAAPNMYSGVNMVLYTNGLLGPRAGLHENTYSGASMVGTPRGIWTIGRIGKPLMIAVDANIYSTSEDNTNLGTVTLSATLDNTPTDPLVATWYDPNGDVYITNPGDSVYSLNWASDSLANLPVRNDGANDAGTETVYLSRDRLYAAGDGRTGGNGGQYVYVSAAADFSNFSDGETFQVGYFNSVRAIVESQNSLNFSTLESTNNIGSGVGWYALTPATPQGDLRRVNTQLGSQGQQEVINAEGGNFYFWSGWSTASSDNPYLVQANGAKFDEESFKHLRLEGTRRFGYYNAPDRTLIYVSDEGSNGLMRVNGAWSFVDFEVPNIAGPVAPTEAGDSFLLAAGAPATAVKVYELPSRLDRPANAGDGNAQPGDDSTTPFNAFFFLPAVQSDNKEMRVRRVIVDFKKWNTGNSTGLNKFTANLRTWGQYNLPSGSADGINLVTAEFSEAETLASTDGTLDRYVMRVGNQGKAAAFQVYFTGIVACAFESVTIEYDEESEEGRTL